MTQSVDDVLQGLGLTLPKAAAPAGSYQPVVQSGRLLFVSGQLPMGPDGIEHIGRCGDNIALEDAQAAARLCALNILAQVRAAAGSLDRVTRIVKLTGFVNSTSDFVDQPKVVNGASDVLVEIFGDRGRHSRAAVGVASLPFGVAVEVEAVVEVAD